jgi:hypothetical protein
MQSFRAQLQFSSSSRKGAIGACDCPRCSDASARWHFKVARIDPLLVLAYCSTRVLYERPVNVRARVERRQCQPDGKTKEHLDRGRAFNRGQPRIGDFLGEADVEVQPERRGYLVVEKLPEATVLRIDPTQQFTFIKSKADGVVGLARTRFPGGRLAGENKRQSVKIGDNAPVDGLVESKQSRLVGEELTNGDRLLASLGKLRPVRGYAFLVIEPTSRMSEC